MRLPDAVNPTADFTVRLHNGVDAPAALATRARAADSAKALLEMESVRARLREAGGQVADLTARLDRARAESEKLGVDLAKARKANAVLLGIRAEQATRIEALEKTVKSSKPGRGRSARDPLRRDAPMDAPLDFSDPFLREDW
jgi:chromosome segregation ATPase